MTSPGPASFEEEVPRPRRLWLRLVGLLAIVVLTQLFMLSPVALVGMPLLLLTLALPGPRGHGFLAGALVVVLLWGITSTEGFWYLERAWAVVLAGWFGVLTWRWPEARVSSRALGAVGGTMGAFGLYFVTHPRIWERVDWEVRNQVGGSFMALGETTRAFTDVSSNLMTQYELSVLARVFVYPALIGLASVAALGSAWWLYVRLSHGRSDGLGPLREFGFNDGMVWFVVAGLALVLLGGAEAGRWGANALVFMGGLYAFRGLAVLAFFIGGFTFATGVLFTLTVLVASPVVIGLAFAVGLGDTWLGLRDRAVAAADGPAG